jgi:hypothetical protein
VLLPDANDETTHIGRKKILARIHSAAQLLSLKDRQPTGDTALLIGDPTSDLIHSKSATEDLAVLFGREEMGMTACTLLQRNATKTAVLDALKKSFRAYVHLGHGGYDGNNLYFALAPEEKGSNLYPQEIVEQDWKKNAPHVHQACCYLGYTLRVGGGRFNSHPSAALYAGASSVLSSTLPLFDEEDAEFCRMLYDKALQPDITLADALLETRNGCETPVVWAQTTLWGNPNVRLV